MSRVWVASKGKRPVNGGIGVNSCGAGHGYSIEVFMNFTLSKAK